MTQQPQHKLNVCGIPAVIEDCPYCDGSGKRMRPDDPRSRPRPHTSAPASYPPSTGDMMEDAYNRGKIDGAKSERARVMRIARAETMHDGIHTGWLMYDSFRQEVEFLRSEQEMIEQ